MMTCTKKSVQSGREIGGHKTFLTEKPKQQLGSSEQKEVIKETKKVTVFNYQMKCVDN